MWNRVSYMTKSNWNDVAKVDEMHRACSTRRVERYKCMIWIEKYVGNEDQ